MKNKLIALLTMKRTGSCTLAGCGILLQQILQQVQLTQLQKPPSRLSAQQLLRLLKLLTQPQTSADKYADLSGSVSMSGSTSMEKLANAVAESFMEKYPNVTVTAEFTGSSAGIESVLAGSVDIGNSSRNLKDDEKSAGAAENIVAIDGIAVVADPANKVEDLTKDQLVSIYTGETKNWSEVGGDDQAIVVVGRRQAPVQEVHLKSCWTSQMPAFTQTNWIPPVPLWQRLLPPPVRSVMFLSML